MFEAKEVKVSFTAKVMAAACTLKTQRPDAFKFYSQLTHSRLTQAAQLTRQ